VHESIWGTRLTCPGGGTYRWNATWHTMESSVYGYPGSPLHGSTVPPVLRDLLEISMGLTFEEDGLRARAVFRR
jgi:hypothetical protein